MCPSIVPAFADTSPWVDVATGLVVDSSMVCNSRKAHFDGIQNDTIISEDDINMDQSREYPNVYRMFELTHPPAVDEPTAPRFSSGVMGYSPPVAGWGSPYVRPAASPVFSPGLPPHLYYSDYYARETGRALSNSNSTSSSLSDDAMFVTEDPTYNEHYHQYQSRVRIMDEQPLVHVPPFYHSPPGPPGHLSPDMAYLTSPNVSGAYNYAPPISPSGPRKPKSRSQTDTRHKAINYKMSAASQTLQVLQAPFIRWCDDFRSDPAFILFSIHSGASPQRSPVSSQPQPERLLPPPPPTTLPPKPMTAMEEKKMKNFFPISWRVIGGGVLMGSEAKSSAEPGTQEYEYVGTHEVSFEGTESERTKISPPKPVRRARSSSIPPAPKTPHVDTGAVRSHLDHLEIVVN
ncbi:hypothetical protein H0H87_011271 [Tephrocybe sp. NHM501043]|nr:hypothetical protein H0H87_011271 [Tephrocybe sp. NHM501043]